MRVLVHLAERAGEVVSREQLETDVWRGTVVGYDSLSNAIAKLRKAFEDDSQQPAVIETIPKVGYRLIASVAETPPPSKTSSDGPQTQSAVAGSVARRREASSRNIAYSLAAGAVLLAAVAISGWLYFGDPAEPDDSSAAPPSLLSDKPSIAVLPFENLSGDPEQEYFSDGMTDDLITDLSKLSGLFVIARNSTFGYKGQPVEARRVAQDLGVRYVLEGSVRRSGNRVRINAQLIDGTTGGHLWADRYDGSLDDVFSLQDSVTARIVAALEVRLTPREKHLAGGRDTSNIAAYDAFLKGWALLLRKTPEDGLQAIGFFEKAIELDPGYSRAYAAMAQIYWDYNLDTRFNIITKNLAGSTLVDSYGIMAWEFLSEAGDHPSSQAHALVSRMLQRQRRFDEAMKEARKAVRLGPSDPTAYDALIENLIYAGETGEAVRLVDESIRLDPNLPGEKLFLKSFAYYMQGRLKEAHGLIERARRHNPKRTRYAAVQAAILIRQDRVAEAKAAFEEYSAGLTVFDSVNWIMFRWPFQSGSDAERFAKDLVEAGAIEPVRAYYAVSRQHRLSGAEIVTLLANRTVIVVDRSPHGSHSDFQMTRDENLQIVDQEYLTYFYPGSDRSRIQGDLLCDPWWEIGDYCVAIYSNPDGTPDQRDEYIFFTLTGPFTFSVIEKVS